MELKEMLIQRESLMWELDGIVDQWVKDSRHEVTEDEMEGLIRDLCDSVCKHFSSEEF